MKYIYLPILYLLITGCEHRAIGYTETLGVHPYFTNVERGGQMVFGVVGKTDSIEIGKWAEIDSEYITFRNDITQNTRYFKYQGQSFWEWIGIVPQMGQPFRQDTDFEKLRLLPY